MSSSFRPGSAAALAATTASSMSFAPVGDLVEFGVGSRRRPPNPLAEYLEAILVGANVLELALAAISLGVAFEMAVEAHHLALEQRRAAAGPGAFDRPRRAAS